MRGKNTCKSFDAGSLKEPRRRVASIVVVVVNDFLLRRRVPPDADADIRRHFSSSSSSFILYGVYFRLQTVTSLSKGSTLLSSGTY